VSNLLKNYENKRFDLVENLAQKLIQKYPDHQLSWVLLGSIFKQTGRYQESLITDQKWASLSPGDAEVHSNLGDTLRELGRLIESMASYEKAIAIKPDYAEAHNNLGVTLRKLGRQKDAEFCYRKAILIKPNYAQAYFNLGNTLKELGSLEDALNNYKIAISIEPGFAEKCEHIIATINSHNPLRANDAYVTDLFDGYAKDFESSLVGNLNYKTPAIISDYLKLLIPFKNIKLDILDLGCGTGLAGEVLIDLAKNLVGIDLSKEMLKLASAKNIYNRLVHSEIHYALNNEKHESFDVIVSSDVFVYIGDLKEIFDGVHNILRVGGFFAYSVEALNSIDNIEKSFSSSDYQLNDNGRYSHSSRYLMNLIDPKQFTLHKMKLEQLRLEKGLPVMGYVVVMQKSS
jgi:predicted TPR repeat methyltransferase